LFIFVFNHKFNLHYFSSFKKNIKLIGLDNSMATSVRGRIKLEETIDTDSQINTITVVTSGRVGRTHIIQSVKHTSVKRTSINPVLHSSLPNIVLCILYIYI